jgi:hypothetical protein
VPQSYLLVALKYIFMTFPKDLLALLLLLSCPHFWPQKFPGHNFFLLFYSPNLRKKKRI